MSVQSTMRFICYHISSFIVISAHISLNSSFLPQAKKSHPLWRVESQATQITNEWSHWGGSWCAPPQIPHNHELRVNIPTISAINNYDLKTIGDSRKKSNNYNKISTLKDRSTLVVILIWSAWTSNMKGSNRFIARRPEHEARPCCTQ